MCLQVVPYYPTPASREGVWALIRCIWEYEAVSVVCALQVSPNRMNGHGQWRSSVRCTMYVEWVDDCMVLHMVWGAEIHPLTDGDFQLREKAKSKE